MTSEIPTVMDKDGFTVTSDTPLEKLFLDNKFWKDKPNSNLLMLICEREGVAHVSRHEALRALRAKRESQD